ncbi:DNA ligase D [Niallia taxi]|uniref:DNA ligase D n=1 Tax=Niallia TaxID=2837506 RepID=UPI00203F9227|nr:DNA ligase D [Niallia sp. MER 6]MCM3030647.1 DNA ligase D [Niallia sp. MER 6]
MKYTASFTITEYRKADILFSVGVSDNGNIKNVGQFSEGLTAKELTALSGILEKNKQSEEKGVMTVTPGICVDLEFTSFANGQIENPVFLQFVFEKSWQECTYEKLLQQIGIEQQITHPDKPLFPGNELRKIDFIEYLTEVKDVMLPFLHNRLLTVIRFPHGLFGDSFYQKQCPEYAPPFVQTSWKEDINYIVCNNEQTLMWLGNQLAFEFHIPFETILSDSMPSEIVFDLDPPSRDHFSLAIKAAQILKTILDGLKLIAFIKISGNKGIQVYIPLPEKTYTYEEARVFTEFIANYMVTMEPKLFTIERLKKNRHNRLYIDYIQHSEGKTIVAPYSIRGNEGGYVACPIHWEELTDSLTPQSYSMKSVQKRIKNNINPFADYFEAKKKQSLKAVLQFIQSNNS